MAPLPTTSTNRLVVDYVWRGRPYTVLYRFADPTTAAAMIAALNAFHTDVAPNFYANWSVPGTASLYITGQTFSTPATLTAVAGGGAGADPGTHSAAYCVQVLGRATGNRRVSYYYKGFVFINDPNQRMEGSGSATVQDLLTAHVNLRTAGLTAINGQIAGYKNYVNLVYNDYLTRIARG